MSDSDLAKIGLVGFFKELNTKVVDWKRTAKIKTSHGFLRKFENAKVGITAFVDDERLEEYEGEDDRLYCHEAGELYVTIHRGSDLNAEFSLMFVAKTFWDRNKHFPDQHWGDVLEFGCGVSPYLIEDECMENTFIPAENYQQGTLEELIAALNAIQGVTYKHLWGDDPSVTKEIDPAQAKLDAAIMSAFQQPLMDDGGYDSWKEHVADFMYENAGEVMAAAMFSNVGPYPKAFDENNLGGMEEVTYVLRPDGKASYTMICEKNGKDVTISVFEDVNGGFEMEIV